MEIANNTGIRTDVHFGDNQQSTVSEKKECNLKMKTRVWTKLREFATSTSAHGFGQMSQSSSLMTAVVWCVFLCCAMGYATYQIVLLILMYRSYPVEVVTRVEEKSSLQFPEVTLCNYNPIKLSLARDSPFAELSQTNISLLVKSDNIFTLKSMEIMSQMSEDKLKLYGHQFEDFIISCRFDGASCNKSDFRWHFNKVYGNCFTFAPQTGDAVVSGSGVVHGLTIQLFLESEEYIPSITKGIGAVAVIHPADQHSFPEDRAIFLGPGQATNIGITTRTMMRLPKPYGDCREKTDTVHLLYSGHYSLPACRKSCNAVSIKRQCGCTHPIYSLQPSCNITGNITQGKLHNANCVRKAHREFNMDKESCFCPPPCQEIKYSTSVSSLLFPSDKYLKVLQEATKGIDSKMADGLRDLSNISSVRLNFAKLQVYFQDVVEKKVMERAKYQRPDLLSNIGGQLGLFIGCSLLTVLEFVKLFCDLCALLVRRPARVNNDTAFVD